MIDRVATTALFFALLFAFQGCEESGDRGRVDFDDDDNDDNDDQDGGSSTGDDDDDDNDDTGSGQCGCSENLDLELIYLLSDMGEIWSFDPKSLKFENLSTIDCPGSDMATVGMAISRNGKTWIEYLPSGKLFNVDLLTGECEASAYAPGQLGFKNLSMTYASKGEDKACEDFYVVDGDMYGTFEEGPDCGRLGLLDEGNLVLSEIAKIDFFNADIKGTGDGRMFLFGGDNPAKLAEIDKEDGSIVETVNLDDYGGYSRIFAFWGGDAYFFTDSVPCPLPGNCAGSRVSVIDFDESEGKGRSLTTVVEEAPLRVGGAGVSTCAPFVPVL